MRNTCGNPPAGRSGSRRTGTDHHRGEDTDTCFGGISAPSTSTPARARRLLALPGVGSRTRTARDRVTSGGIRVHRELIVSPHQVVHSCVDRRVPFKVRAEIPS